MRDNAKDKGYGGGRQRCLLTRSAWIVASSFNRPVLASRRELDREGFPMPSHGMSQSFSVVIAIKKNTHEEGGGGGGEAQLTFFMSTSVAGLLAVIKPFPSRRNDSKYSSCSTTQAGKISK